MCLTLCLLRSSWTQHESDPAVKKDLGKSEQGEIRHYRGEHG